MAGYIGTKAVALSTTTGNILGDMTVGGTTDLGTLEFNSLSGTGSVTITDILDEDNLASNSATKLATQQSIKAYVDAQVDTVDTLAEILAIGNRTSGTGKIEFRDAAIFINSSTDGQLDLVADTEIQLAATTVDLNGNLDVSGTALVTGVLTTTAEPLFNGGINLPNVNTFIKGGGHNVVQVDSTRTYLYGGTDGVQFRTADNASALVDITNDGLLKFSGGSAVDNSNTAFNINLPATGGLTIGSAFTFANIHGDSGGSVYIKANAYPANTGSASSITLQTANSSGGTDSAVTVSGGNIAFASGKGIDFGATSGPSSGTATSEILSDYEEGDHECTVTMGSGTCTLNSGYNKIKYTKVGRNVTIQGQIQVSSTSNPSGTMRVTLPYTMATTSNEGANVGGGVVRAYDSLVPTGGLYLWGVTVFNTGAFVTLEWVKHNSATVNHVPQANEYLIFSFSYTTT